MHRPVGPAAPLKLLLAAATLLIALSQSVHAQILEVKNQFVAGQVEAATGLLTVKDVVAGKSKNYLTNPGHSYLNLSVNGRWYTNNNVGGQNLVAPSLGAPGTSVTPVPLDGGISQIIGDTIRTTFDEGGTPPSFSIVQDVYPVAFRASGQVVLKVKIVNHSLASVSVDGLQWLNDVQAGTNDNPYIFERSYYDGNNWRVNAGTPAPSFYFESEGNPNTLNLGVIGCGFTNDSFPPSPMGLTPCTAFAAVSWQGTPAAYQALNYLYGCPSAPTPPTTTDMACVLQWSPKGVPPAPANGDTTVEEFRTSFGTQEFCMCLGNALSVNIFPTHLQYDQHTKIYTPNPFSVLSIVFNTQASQISNVNMTHSTAGPIHIVGTQAGGTIATGGQSSSYKGAAIAGGAVKDFLWSDKTDPNTNCSGQGGYYTMDFSLTGSGLSGSWDCAQPGNHNGTCDVLVDCADVDTVAPLYDTWAHTFPGGAYVDSSFMVHDSGPKDFGLRKVYWTYNPPSVAALFPVTVGTFADCSKQPVKVDILQKDSTVAGCVEFQFTDCAGNVRPLEICFAAHPPALLPDTVAPKFYNRGYDTQNVPLQIGGGCTSLTNYRFSKWTVMDTAAKWHQPKFGHGIKSVTPYNVNNAKITVSPFGVAPETVDFTFDVLDSMYDADACILAIDTAGNRDSMCLHYCTVHDTTPPTITTASTRRACTVHVTDSVAWDRGIDSVYIFDATNVQGVPEDTNKVGCKSTFTLVVQSINPNLPACFRVRAIDCAGNADSTGTICLGQDTDVHCPTITTTQVDFTRLHVVVTDSTDAYDQGIDSVWFTGVKNMKLVHVDPPASDESHCPGDPATTFNAIHGAPTGQARPKFQKSVTFDLVICDTSNINLNQACVTINAVDGAHDLSTNGHLLCSGAYTWCQPISVDVLPPLIIDSNATCSSVTFKATDNRADDRGLDEFKLTNTVNLTPFDLSGLAGSDRGVKDMTLSVITKGKSAYGTLTAIDAFGAKQTDPAVKLAHTATGDFWLYAQDLVMKAGHVFLAAGDYKVRVLIDKSDLIKLAQKKIWKLAFSFHLEGDPNIQFVSAQAGSFAPNWNVTVANPNPRYYTITAGGPNLPDWSATGDDELLTLTFHANTTPNTGATHIVIDPLACGNDSYAITYNDGLDTGVTFTNTTMTMHAPFGNINGGVLTIKGECSPFVSEGGKPPTSISLAPVTPNPAWHGAPSLHLMYTVADEGLVKLDLFNALGDKVRSVVSESQKQGEYQLDVSSGDLPEGMYFLRLEAAGETITRRVVVGGY